MNRSQDTIRIGADVGGTFTDVIVMDRGRQIWRHKLPSTPPEFERAVLEAIDRLMQQKRVSCESVAEVAHGTTVAANAVLERRGARTALVTTKGFRDVLELRRIRSPRNYDLFFDKPPPLVPRHLRFELTERVTATGEVLAPLDRFELRELKVKLLREHVESVAVAFLHSYAFPEHELIVRDFLKEQLPDLVVSVSSEVLPERKEYERTATTVVNAYVRPVMRRYLDAVRAGLQERQIRAPLLIMQSAGGLTPEEDAARQPVYSLESGPAAGVRAARATAKCLGLQNVITLDMGGTTAKAAMIEAGKIACSAEYEVGASLLASSRLMGGGGELIRVPSIDIAEVGAGGGSIASLDSAGGLRVGPHSAGAVPGPACYGRGGMDPTVTDANVVLGYIRPGRLANGDVRIDPEAARRTIHDKIAAPLGMELVEAAEGIHSIANARTMRALREVSTQRGRDPRDFALIAFGGSGPIHAAGLSRQLLSTPTIVPPMPGLFSALGLLSCGVEHHDVRSCLLSMDGLTAEALERWRADMSRRMREQLQAEGFSDDEIVLRSSVDVRFRGQASEIRIDLEHERFTDDTVRHLLPEFAREHERLYGHRSDPENPVEVVAVRLVGQAGGHDEIRAVETEELPERASSRRAYFGKTWGAIDTPIVSRRAFAQWTDGPLLIDEYDSTIVVPPGMRARLDEFGNLLMERTDA